MKNLKNLLLFIFKINLILLFSGCSVFFQPPYLDITSDPRMNHLVDKCFILKHAVFLYQYPDTKDYALGIPGKNTMIPYSLRDYRNDPLNWQNTDWNAQSGKGLANGYLKLKIIGIVEAGTKIYVYKIKEKKTLYESFVEVIARIDDPRYSNLAVDIHFLLERKPGKTFINYPSEPEISTMGCEKNFYENPGVIEYCDDEENSFSLSNE